MAEYSVTIASTLSALIAERKYTTVRDILVTMNPSDIAYIFAELEEERLPLFFRLLPKELAAETFVEMFGTEDYVYTLTRGEELQAKMEQVYSEFSNWLASWEM